MSARKRYRRLWVVLAMLLIARASAAGALESQVLPPVTDAFPASYDVVWEATLRSLRAAPPALVDKAQGRIESAPFFFYFPFDARVSQGILVSLAITVNRVNAQHTTVHVQPRVYFMIYDGVLPGPVNNPSADLFVRIRGNLGQGAPASAPPGSIPDECRDPGRAASSWCRSLLFPNQWGGWRHPTN